MPQVQNRVLVHFVWTTYNRMPWVKQALTSAIYRHIEAVVRKDGCDVLAIGGMPDHIHLFVCLATTIASSTLMRHVKGSTARLINRDLAPDAFFQWQGGYGAFSVSPSDKARVVAYIQNQEQHHQDGSLWAAEPGDDDPIGPE